LGNAANSSRRRRPPTPRIVAASRRSAPAEEFGPVHQRFHHVRDAAAAQIRISPSFAFAASGAVGNAATRISSLLAPQRHHATAEACIAAPTAAATVTSKMVSSDWPER
jgi:hypothetical protein